MRWLSVPRPAADAPAFEILQKPALAAAVPEQPDDEQKQYNGDRGIGRPDE